jgi:hypothetical protein
MNRLASNIRKQLYQLSDPEFSIGDAGANKLGEQERQELFVAAAEHGVLGIVLQNLQKSDPSDCSTTELISRRWRAEMVKSVRLRHHGQQIMQALVDARIPGFVFKGMDFAQHLYPIPSLRPWRDIDLLVPQDQWPAAGEVLDALGYEKGPDLWAKYDSNDYGEQSWHYRANRDIVVELHWNLIRAPSLRRRASVTYGDLDWIDPVAENSWPEVTPASRVLIAAVHSTYMHQFDRMLLLCDLRQACRRLERQSELASLRTMADRTGTRAALDLALFVAAKLLNDSLLESIRLAVGSQRGSRIAGRLVSRQMLLSDSLWYEARRRVIREWLKRAA